MCIYIYIATIGIVLSECISLQLGSKILQPQGWETQVKSTVPLGCTEMCDCATGMQYDDVRLMFYVEEMRNIPTSKTALTTGCWVKVAEINCGTCSHCSHCSHSDYVGVSQGISRQIRL